MEIVFMPFELSTETVQAMEFGLILFFAWSIAVAITVGIFVFIKDFLYYRAEKKKVTDAVYEVRIYLNELEKLVKMSKISPETARDLALRKQAEVLGRIGKD